MAHKIKLYHVEWSSTNAGPSPDGDKRTELFFKGCRKAEAGNPCKNCFNPNIWSSEAQYTYTASELCSQILKTTSNKYVTIVGGEPTDQPDGLKELCAVLKASGFHIILFTWRSLSSIENSDSSIWTGLLEYIDVLVDGEYIEALHIYDPSKENGLYNVVGSGNQIIWDIAQYNSDQASNTIYGVPACDLEGIFITDNGELKYITKLPSGTPVSIVADRTIYKEKNNGTNERLFHAS